jgi:inner membrane protein
MEIKNGRMLAVDTGSHLLFGATLAGLAMLQPEVAQDPALAHAVLAGTLIGSHAPDFDTAARLKGYAHYVRHHRGITHSLPALFIWPLVLSLPIAACFGVGGHWGVLYVWTMIAVMFHVFLDWLNAYGVQCFRPFSKRWYHLDTLALYEPFLFLIHSAGVLFWIFKASNPGGMFLLIYGVTFLYIALRYIQHAALVGKVKRDLKLEGICHVVPSLSWFHWQFILETADHFYMGNIEYGKVLVKDVLDKERSHPIIQATMRTDGVRAFLHFAQRVHVSFREKQDGYVVQWRDVRFWHNHKLPFGVDVKLDRNLNVVSHSLGWKKKAWDPPYV